MFALISRRDKKRAAQSLTESDIIETNAEPELDLKKLSDTHYLLEAGKNEWRLNNTYYHNPKALLVYVLAHLYNNPLDDYSNELLESLEVRMRLTYVLYTYSDEKQPMEVQIQQLTDKILKRIKKIPKDLQIEYHLCQNEEGDTSIDLVKKLTLILSA